MVVVLATVDAPAAELIVSKSKRSLEFREGAVSQVFPIGLGSAPFGPKSMQGDRKTPKGLITSRVRIPRASSTFRLASVIRILKTQRPAFASDWFQRANLPA